MKENLKVGHDLFFALTHFCLLITIITLVWINIIPSSTKEIDILTSLFYALVLLITGIGGIGLYICLIPTLRKVEQDYIKLMNIKNANNKKNR